MKIRITDNLKKIISVPLVGFIMATSFSGCSEKPQIVSVEAGEYEDKIFNEGEHIISIPIDDPTIENTQYEHHDGYKVVGISTTGYGKGAYHFGEAYLLYTNTYPVKCQPTYQYEDTEELLYTEFGEPLNYEKAKTSSGKGWKEFAPGEHIISIPGEDMNNSNCQIDFHDGYEPIGIATAEYGKGTNHFGGNCILYTNTKNVKCTEDEKGNYTYFGVPEEDTKILKK